MTPKKKSTKAKPRAAGKKDKRKKTANTYEVKPHRYGITFATGSPARYNEEELAKEIDAYYEYIKGEYVEQEVVIKNAKTGKTKVVKQQVCIREPEPATITGLTLYLGFSCLETLTEYGKKGPKFAEIVKRGKLRVANRYERNLSGTTPTGAIFALKNMGWKEGNFLEGLDEEGSGVIAFKYIVPTKPKNDED